MSRSYKKHAVLKNNDKDMRKLGNRKLRRKVKNSIQKENENMPLIDEVSDPYDICDNKYMPPKSDEKWYNKAKRK